MATIKKFQNNFTTGYVSPGLYARVDLAKYASGCKRLLNGVVHAHGGVSNRPGTRFVSELPGNGRLIPFQYSVQQTYVLAFIDKPEAVQAVMRVYEESGELYTPDGVPYEVETPYAPSDIQALKFAQSADVMFLAHPSYPPYKLVRKGHTEWVFEQIEFKPAIDAPTNLKATESGFKDDSGTYVKDTCTYKVSAVNERDVESMPSEPVEADILSTWPTGAKVKLTWDEVKGAVRYEVYKNTRGYYAWLGSAETNEFTDDYIEGNANTGPKEYRNPFDGEGNYPGAVGIYQQRLVFGRSNNEPHTVWLSETGAFDSMAVATPLRDDSAITATVDSKQMNEIRHFIPLREVLMLTSGAEFQLSAGRNSDSVTPTTISFNLQSYWGCSDVPPIVVGMHVLFAENSGLVVRDLKYQLADDGYTGEDRTVLASDLLRSPVISWAYQQSPWSTVWVCLSDGKLLTLTYMPQQEIWAWSEHESSGGKFRSTACIREGAQDVVYFIVQRDDRYFVEVLDTREYGRSIEDSFFVDCGLEYRDKANPISHVKGLSHLAGKEIVVLADGSVVRGITVAADGSFDLPHRAGIISAGLPYVMEVETLDPEIKSSEGSTSGLRKNVTDVTLWLRESRGLKIGPAEGTFVEAKFPPPESWSAAPPLFSGQMKVILPGHHRDEATVLFRQEDPLPLTVLGLVTSISVG